MLPRQTIALEEETCEELKLGPIVPLGRPYTDVWMEESYTESLEQRALYRERDGYHHHHHHHQHHQQVREQLRGRLRRRGTWVRHAEGGEGREGRERLVCFTPHRES